MNSNLIKDFILKRLNKKGFLISFTLNLILTIPILAHPHVFIDANTTFSFNNEGLNRIKVCWTFDNLFSTMIFNDYDTNKDNKFNTEETQKIKEEAFSNLKEYQYFTFIKINKKPFIVKYISDFKILVDDKNITYSFIIPCNLKAQKQNKEIQLAYYDESYYIDLSFNEDNPVNLENNRKLITTYKIKDNFNDGTMNDENIFPQELILNFKKKG